jgi:MFS family permease
MEATMKPAWKHHLPAVLCGGIIMGLALGVRHVQGLFLLPMTSAHGWSRADFALAFALQNLMWGLLMPVTGMIADRFGAVRVLLGGCILYAVGLALMAHADTPAGLMLSGGVVNGAALAATSFGTVYGALSRIVPPERRSWALALAGAVGGLGQFSMVPLAQGLIKGAGWMMALLVMAAIMVAIAPLSLALRDGATHDRVAQRAQSLGQAVREALSHRGFWLLNLGFLACGFQLAFIAGHLPAYLLDRGLSGRSAVVALFIIALANVPGTYLCGVLGARFRRKELLAYLYLFRSLLMAAFVLLPLSETTVFVFAFLIGLVWLGTVPLTNGIVSQVFGVKYVTTLFGFVFLGHQLGAFLGVWLGGLVYDATRSYDLVWLASIGLGLAAAALHWPIDDREIVRLPVAPHGAGR